MACTRRECWFRLVGRVCSSGGGKLSATGHLRQRLVRWTGETGSEDEWTVRASPECFARQVNTIWGPFSAQHRYRTIVGESRGARLRRYATDAGIPVSESRRQPSRPGYSIVIAEVDGAIRARCWGVRSRQPASLRHNHGGRRARSGVRVRPTRLRCAAWSFDAPALDALVPVPAGPDDHQAEAKLDGVPPGFTGPTPATQDTKRQLEVRPCHNRRHDSTITDLPGTLTPR